ncbi:MAG: GGDEF domain-containing protein [Terriglobales bacterium]
MISLKKYLEMEVKEARSSDPDPAELLRVCLESYRTVLRAMGESGVRACPAVGSDLQETLGALARRLGDDFSPAMLAEMGTLADEELRQWGERTAEHFKAKATEVKELLIMLAQAAQSVGERDQRYTAHFQQLTTRLRTISNLEDLAQVRTSLTAQAAELKIYVEKMGQDSEQVVENLKMQVSTYETRLKKVEEMALRDPLTGLANRRKSEDRIEARIAAGRPFCVMLLDLNRFKQVNDKYGHLAGDNLLQQFSQELRSSMRATDLVGRWGGDEFIVVMECDAAGAKAQLERMKKWVFGNYTIRPGKGTGEVQLAVDAATGFTEWQAGDTVHSMIERADAAMYREKQGR